MTKTSSGALELDNGEKVIIIDHITIRQSIFFLILKLLFVEITAAFFVVSFHTALLSSTIKQTVEENQFIFNMPIFIILVVIKSLIMIIVIIKWLNNYFEITTTESISKKGLFFKKEEKILLNHVQKIEFSQGFFGKVFNFGSINLITKGKELSLYLIHNPAKYRNILEDLIPDADRGIDVFINAKD